MQPRRSACHFPVPASQERLRGPRRFPSAAGVQRGKAPGRQALGSHRGRACEDLCSVPEAPYDPQQANPLRRAPSPSPVSKTNTTSRFYNFSLRIEWTLVHEALDRRVAQRMTLLRLPSSDPCGARQRADALRGRSPGQHCARSLGHRTSVRASDRGKTTFSRSPGNLGNTPRPDRLEKPHEIFSLMETPGMYFGLQTRSGTQQAVSHLVCGPWSPTRSLACRFLADSPRGESGSDSGEWAVTLKRPLGSAGVSLVPVD